MLGSEDCPINADDEEVEFSMSFRIPRIENLEKCLNLKVSNRHSNLIETRSAQKPY